VGCPPAQLVQALVEGYATDEERTRLEAHARGCQACRDLIALSRTSDAGDPVEGERLAEGTVVGGFVIDRVLGAGAMGIVYAAHDPALDRRVALKLLLEESPARRERFAREGQALARVTHANVCGVYEIGEHDGRLFIVMEHVDGETLGSWLREAPRPLRELLPRFAAAARGLAAAHAAGVVHRDFKPDNVLLGKDGRVRVSDFGLAGWLTPAEPDDATPASLHASHAGTLLGTPIYMSPEQHAGRVADERSDQFSFAAALFHAIHGLPPFAGDSLETLASNARQGRIRTPPDGPPVPRRLDRALRRALAPRPEDRFPSIAALAAELEQRPTRWARWIGGGALLAAVAIAVAVVVLPAGDRCARGDGAACLAAAEPLRASLDLAAVGPRLGQLYQRGCDAGHLLACTRLGSLMTQGLGVPLDPPRAHPLFRRACEGGEPEACAHLGAMYENGEPIAPDAVRAVAAYQQSCEGGHGLGCTLLGGLRRRGLGLPQDRAAARRDHQRGCELGSALACSTAAEELVESSAAGQEAEGLRLAARGQLLAREGCRLGEPLDCVVLGLDALRDWNAPRDYGRAAAAFQRGCDAGGGHACALLGRLYLTGLGVSADAARAVDLYERGCLRLDSRACGSLGLTLAEGMGVPVEADKGRTILERLCARRVPVCWPLGRLYKGGTGNLPADPARALALYEQDCDTRFEHAPQGCWRAGRAYRPGGWGPVDPVRERTLLARGCELGSVDACSDLAAVHLREGRASDAFSLMTMACRSAGADCAKLARLYLEGAGTEKSLPRALEILEKACAIGDGESCQELGTLNLEGRHVPVSPFRALGYLEKGCAGFDAPSCLSAAKILDGGRGLAAQPARAIELRRQGCQMDPTLCR
jgi:TPR repeat protein/predicted Ser/Thr protein kinase